MSGIRIVPEGGGEIIEVPTESTVIGRGAFLKVTDKRVSRSHALLEVIDGKLHLTPTHTNPCFLRKGGSEDQEVLRRDLRQILEEGDIFGLLPDQLFYTVTYAPVNGVKSNGDAKTSVKREVQIKKVSKPKKDIEEDEEEEPEEEEGEELDDHDELSIKAQIISVIRADGKNIALPLTKKRTLPAWMIRLHKASAPVVKKRQMPVKVEAPIRQVTTPRRASAGRKTYDDDFVNDDDNYDDEDYDERPARRRGATKSPRAAAKPKRRTYDDDFIGDEESEEETRPKKRGRRQVSDDDDDYVESDEEPQRHGKRRRRSPSDEDFDSEAERPKRRKPAKRRRKVESDDDEYEVSSKRGKRKGTRSRDAVEDRGTIAERRPRRAATQKRGSYVDDFMLGDDFEESDEAPAKPDSDSDFHVEDIESGSDEGKKRKLQKVARTPARRGGRSKRKVQASDSAEEEEIDFEESEEEYRPRGTKRRAAATPTKKRRKGESEDSEEEEAGEEEGEVAEDDEDEDDKKKVSKRSPSKTPVKKEKKPCFYGKNCYRRNPDHFKQFYHPGESDEEEGEGEDEKEEDEMEEENEEESETKEGKDKDLEKKGSHGKDKEEADEEEK